MTNSPFNLTERTILSEILQDFYGVWDFTPDVIRGVIKNGDRSVILFTHDFGYGFASEFYTVWLANEVKLKKHELLVREVCKKQNFYAYPNADDPSVTIVEDKDNCFIGCIGFDGDWYVNRKSGNGIPITVNNVNDAVSMLWVLEVATL